MVGVVCAMRDSPAVVWYHDATVYNVTDKVIEGLVIGEALVTAVVANNKESPEHGALSKPVEGPDQWVVEGESTPSHAGHNCDIKGKEGEGFEGATLEALGWDGVTEVLKGEWRWVGETASTLWIEKGGNGGGDGESG